MDLEDGITPAQLREEAKLLNEMADGIGLTSKQRKATRKRAKELKQRARDLETSPEAPKRWMVVFGDEGSETGFIESPEHLGKPGWTYDREEAEQLCPPGGRVVDADVFTKAFNARLWTQ